MSDLAGDLVATTFGSIFAVPAFTLAFRGRAFCTIGYFPAHLTTAFLSFVTGLAPARNGGIGSSGLMTTPVFLDGNGLIGGGTVERFGMPPTLHFARRKLKRQAVGSFQGPVAGTFQPLPFGLGARTYYQELHPGAISVPCAKWEVLRKVSSN
jgi:hypothetical protein